MARQMYFGTQERMTWVNAPTLDAGLSKGNWGAEGVYLNGGGYVRRSAAGHKRYEWAWNMAAQTDIDEIVDYADGVYGDGLLYFLDPFAIASNCLPQHWATPRLAQIDAPSLVTGKRPILVDTAVNSYRYPTKSAVYTLVTDDTFASVWIPLPTGYTLHFGAHGSATSTAAVTVQGDGGAVTAVTLLTATTSALTNTTVSGVTGVTISLQGAGNLTLAGMVAQVLPTAASAPTGDFISGKGHSGCRFLAGEPVVTGYSAPSALDKISASATLVETGAWEEA